MIQLNHVTYTYPDQATPALADFSAAIQPGEFVLVVGPSGAGKSTFLRSLNGLVPHFYGGRWSGRADVFGRDPVALAPRGMADLVGFVFQDPEAQFVVDTVEDELAFAMENFALPPATMRKRVEEVLDQMAIAHLRGRRISTLSGGEKQRVAIAAVLALQPEVLVLDEPTSQLDPQAAEEVLIALRQLNEDLGLTVILSEHRLERVVQYADRVLYLPAGRAARAGRARVVMAAQLPLVPPLIELGRTLGWQPLPLTIKEGRAFARRLSGRLAGRTETAEHGDSGEAIEPDTHRVAASPRHPVVDVRSLHYAYDGRAALRGVSLAVTPGEFVALMGRNGSGKSTLLKQMVGLLKPDEGQVTVAGLDTRKAALDDIIRTVGYVPQHPGCAALPRHAGRGAGLHPPRPRACRPIRRPTRRCSRGWAWADWRTANPRDLSGGEQQRAALASILVANRRSSCWTSRRAAWTMRRSAAWPICCWD